MKESISPASLVFFVVIGIAALLAFACSVEEDTPEPGPEPQPADPCDNGPKKIEIAEYLHAFEDQSTGSFEVAVSGGNGSLVYSIDGESFTKSNAFTGLAAGIYTITVRDDSLCTATLEYTVEEFPEVSFASHIKPIIDTNCQIDECHGHNQQIPSWDSYVDIADRAERIRYMVTERLMPKPSSGGSLTDQQIEDIQNWVDVGAPNN